MTTDRTLSPAECAAVSRLVADGSSCLVVRLDPAGRIRHATGGLLPSAGCTHVRDLVDRASVAALEAHLARIALTGSASGWFEVMPRAPGPAGQRLQMRLIGLPDGTGSIAMLRAMEQPHGVDQRLFAAALTDPLTGLTNRAAFTRMLDHLIERGAPGHLLLFDIDHFRAINLRHGHSGGDRVLIAFARLLRELFGPDAILSRIDGGSFGVLLPRSATTTALAAANRVIGALGELAGNAPPAHRLSASAGVAAFGASADHTLREVELAQVAAKSAGRGKAMLAGAARFRRSAA